VIHSVKQSSGPSEWQSVKVPPRGPPWIHVTKEPEERAAIIGATLRPDAALKKKVKKRFSSDISLLHFWMNPLH
jgi:hypothetical protein